jgi:hypothetical protein
MKVERVVLDALAEKCGLPADSFAFGNWFGLVFRPGESSMGEVDPPLCSTRTRCFQRVSRVCFSQRAD